jgi:DNA-binding transcriptional ArsR family regulator
MEEARGLLEGDSPDPRGATRLALILQEKLEVLRQLDGEILDLTEDEADITNEIEHSESYNQDICDLVLNLKECSKESTPNSTPATNPVAGGTPSYNARLPKLTLKPFDGDITKWLSFWDSYQAAVHSNPEISDVQKFTYLKSLVEGTAREAISGLSLSADNYEEAVGILEKRFGNKQRIIDRHLDILLNLEQVSSANNVVALRHLYDQVESNVRALGALGIPDDSYGTLLASVLLKKLPQEMRLLVSRKVTDEWAVKTIMKAIGEELEARERMGMSLMAGGMNDVKKKIERHSVATLITGQGIKENPICSYCKGTHLPSNCEVITSTEERRRILKSTGKCFICLRKGHISCDCQNVEGAKEGTTLAYVKQVSQATRNSQVTTPLNPAAQPFQTPTTCYLSEGNSAILLQTAKVTLYNPHRTEFQLEVLLIFDSGSQRSYIKQSVTERLKLQKQGNKVLSIMTFGAKTSTQQSCEVVCVGLMKDGCPIKNISILSVPTICEPLKGPPVSEILESYPSLCSLELANTTFS